MYSEKQYDEFAKRMEEHFPKMFADQYGGFAIGAGWWNIIELLSHQIQSHIDWNNKTREDLLKHNPNDVIVPEEIPQVVVKQVKEKFGGLRFYYEGGNETIHGMVRMAEVWAGVSCEECGSPGKRVGGGWARTLCDFHIVEKEAMAAEQARKDGLEL